MQQTANTKFRELYIHLPEALTARFAATLDAALRDGWTRLPQSKEASPDPFDWHIYYVCRKRRNRPAALLAIYRRDIDTLYVSNIVPKDIRELSNDQYNSILLDFHHNVLRNLKPNFPLKFLLTSDQVHPPIPVSASSASSAVNSRF